MPADALRVTRESEAGPELAASLRRFSNAIQVVIGASQRPTISIRLAAKGEE